MPDIYDGMPSRLVTDFGRGDGWMPADQVNTVTSSTNFWSGEVVGFNSIVVHFAVNTGAANTLIVEQSMDNSNWTTVLIQNQASYNSGAAGSTQTVGVHVAVISARYVRVRATYVSGTCTAYIMLRMAQPTQALAPVTGTVVMLGANASTSPGGTISRVKTTASNNLTSLKASAGTLMGFGFFNNAATKIFVKFYQKASAPVVASDTPLFTIGVPIGDFVVYQPAYGMRFSTGIAYAITGGIGDTDATNTAADDINGWIHWI